MSENLSPDQSFAKYEIKDKLEVEAYRDTLRLKRSFLAVFYKTTSAKQEHNNLTSFFFYVVLGF